MGWLILSGVAVVISMLVVAPWWLTWRTRQEVKALAAVEEWISSTGLSDEEARHGEGDVGGVCVYGSSNVRYGML